MRPHGRNASAAVLAARPARASVAARCVQQSVHPTQFLERILGILPLALHQLDLLNALLPRELERTRVGALAGLDHFDDLGQRKAELLGLEDEGEAVDVASRVVAGHSVAPWRNEATALVEAQRTGRDAVLPGHLADR